MKELPPAPTGWSKTVADLFAEIRAGRRSSVGSPEIDWARDYERHLLPPDTRFPCKGDVYEALEDFEANYLTSWAAPFTGGGTANLLKGEKVEVRHAALLAHPILVYVYPVDYQVVERRVVAESERKAKGYEGFYFAIKTADLNTKFRLMHTGTARESRREP